MKTTVQATEFTDVRGKQQKYLIIGDGEAKDNVIINVGEKTFTAVKNLIEGKKAVNNQGALPLKENSEPTTKEEIEGGKKGGKK